MIKEVTFISVLCLFSLTCSAQRIMLSKSASIDPPKNMVKVQDSKVSALVGEKFAGTKYLHQNLQNNPDKVFTVGDMVIFINSASMAKTPGFLDQRRLGSDDSGKQIKGYSSRIDTIKGKRVFIINQTSEGFKLYRFTTVNKSEDFVVVGFVQYKPGDEAKARTVLEDIVKGLKFD